MSHSTALVIIRNANSASEAQDQLDTLLAPFDENTSVDPYIVWLDQEQVDNSINYYRENPNLCGLNGPEKPFDQYVTEGNLEAWHEWTRQAVGGYYASDPDDGTYDADHDRFGYECTYNPRSKWDWWALGGRWHGFFQLKPSISVGSEPLDPWQAGMGPIGKEEGRTFGSQQVGNFAGHQDAILGNGGVWGDDEAENFESRADLARKGDIDFETQRTLAAQHADLVYDRFEEATKGIEVGPRWNDVLRLAFVEANVDPEMDFRDFMPEEEDLERRREAWQAITNVARKQYHDHPWIKALNEADLIGFLDDPHETYCVNAGGRAKYVERARDHAHVTFAVLLDGEWYEKGSMGWFGMIANEKDPDAWSREYWRLVESLPDDVYLAVVDVHI